MAPASATPDSKKRVRPRADESDHDELSAKKPRLTTTTSPSSAVPATNKRKTPSSLRPLSSTVSGAFESRSRKVSTNSTVKKGKEPIDKTWEIPDSDGEEAARKKAAQPRKQTRTTAAESPVKNPSGVFDGVYDFPDPDAEEPSPAQTPSRRTRGPSSSTARRITKSQSQSPGLKRGERSTTTKENYLSNQKGKGKDNDDTPEVSSSEDELTPAPVRSINKVRGATRANPNGGTPKLKGILTPSRRLSERNSKNVAFDETNFRTDEVYFSDLPSKANKTKPSKQKTQPSPDKENEPAEKARTTKVDEEEDDEVCAICSKPDSKPPNEILFCDNCDVAVHQKCYGVAKIPKGEWLCKGCSQEPSSGVGAGERKVTVVAENAPDILNFKQHLRALQRVLLDRCSGRRRIQLRDQDEAYDKTFQLVEQTVLAGEGNSMLVIGARGCGKTTVSDLPLVIHALKEPD